jgi:protein SCO1/2
VEALEQRRPGMAAGALHALTGKSQAVAAVTEALGYRYAWDERIGQYAHVAAVAVLTPDGRLARWIRGLAPDPGDVRLALTEAGQGRLGDWSDRLLLLCYHYDPETGRYSALVRMILRIAAGILLIAGAGFLAVALWRDRRLAGRGGP